MFKLDALKGPSFAEAAMQDKKPEPVSLSVIEDRSQTITWILARLRELAAQP